MNPHRLITPLLSATLFLGAGAFAQTPDSGTSPAASPLLAPPAAKPRLSERETELLKRFDKNGDGTLDEDELAAAHETMYREQEQREVYARRIYDQLLALFDKDHKGSLNPAEQAQALDYVQAHIPEAYDRILKRFDRAGEGKLTADESAAVFRYLTNIPSIVTAAPPSAAPAAATPAPGAKKGFAAGQRFYATLLENFDRNHEGRLNPAEQAEAIAFIRDNRPGVYEALLQRFDKNGDGALDAEETASMFAQLEKLGPQQASSKSAVP